MADLATKNIHAFHTDKADIIFSVPDKACLPAAYNDKHPTKDPLNCQYWFLPQNINDHDPDETVLAESVKQCKILILFLLFLVAIK